MSEVCGNHPDCGFFSKYAQDEKAQELGNVKLYCQGPRQGACERAVYRKTFLANPPDEMMPNGALVA
ncbi:hypothetical protein FHS83_002765 [Rhizomicrobium palustre]|uniref:Uncharacterized protein n=1 Tax=Rhizomicrobium palustre TaxID=189966 RepID=A0A846N2V1_9PROT|nr:hypothetical protein [Rhizomicrobium palustre]NIK89447.1 hypothetical protein [Rhizomicrobium palustre]